MAIAIRVQHSMETLEECQPVTIKVNLHMCKKDQQMRVYMVTLFRLRCTCVALRSIGKQLGICSWAMLRHILDIILLLAIATYRAKLIAYNSKVWHMQERL